MACVSFAGGFLCGVNLPRCKVPGCGRRAAAECDWRLHRVVDGRREYTGKTCDMPVCEGHRHQVGQHASGPYAGQSKDLCPAHRREAERQGLLR